MEKKAYMGTSNVLNSYVAELYGILMAVQKIRQTRHTKKQVREIGQFNSSYKSRLGIFDRVPYLGPY